MNLRDVIQPSIDLAENGFILDYNLPASFDSLKSEFIKYPSSRKIFLKNDNNIYYEGDTFKQPDLAKTLKLIRDKGKDGFYR